MTIDNTTSYMDEQVGLTPLEPVATDANRLDAIPDFEPLPGQYHIVQIDNEGNEVPFSDFSCAESSLKFYTDITKFKVKKNPN